MRFVRIEDIDWIEAAMITSWCTSAATSTASATTLTRPSSACRRTSSCVSTGVDRQRRCIREMQPWFQGRLVLILVDGTRVTTRQELRERLREFIERSM